MGLWRREESGCSVHSAAVRSREIQWVFLLGWPDHTAAEISDPGRDGIWRCGRCGPAAAIARRKTKPQSLAASLTLPELVVGPRSNCNSECQVTEHIICSPENKKGRRISPWVADGHCPANPSDRQRYRGEAAEVWQSPLLGGKQSHNRRSWPLPAHFIRIHHSWSQWGTWDTLVSEALLAASGCKGLCWDLIGSEPHHPPHSSRAVVPWDWGILLTQETSKSKGIFHHPAEIWEAEAVQEKKQTCDSAPPGGNQKKDLINLLEKCYS